ncbi:arf-GAP with coiled-coil, ANK repeat and PH domain-containing protein 1-like, partial [Pyrgilauda ruficollis]|uniref:arf-GAP with coiled-coil, ANK repeat and PH domain-containing protein 1-like n=1 Tax=Pyrgilauda ruficollis TaxID=221976 RepID=UPI001B85EFC2
AALEEAESDAAELETHLEKVLKLCSAVLEAGRVLEVSSRAFAAGLRELAETPRGDPLVQESLQKFCDSLEQMMDSHEELRSCTQSALGRNLEPLLRHSLRALRSSGRERARAAELLQGALQHHAEVPRRRPLEAKEAAAALGGARGVARARGLDYVLKLRLLQDQQKTEILQFDEVGVAAGEAGPEAPPMEGYLYKRASNAFRTWSRFLSHFYRIFSGFWGFLGWF